MSDSFSAPAIEPQDARAWDHRWWLTGLGGYGPAGSFEHVAGHVVAMKNGTELNLSIRFPGDVKVRTFSLSQRELRSLLASGTGPFRGHLMTRLLRAEVITDSVTAHAEANAGKSV